MGDSSTDASQKWNEPGTAKPAQIVLSKYESASWQLGLEIAKQVQEAARKICEAFGVPPEMLE